MPAEVPSTHILGLTVTATTFALYETPDRKECPDGFNSTNQQNYLLQFPDEADRKAREEKFDFGYGNRGPNGENVFYNPTAAEDPLPFREAVSDIAPGVNLDGKIGPNDFTSPEGEKGIDNQLYRLLGCVEGFRKNGEGYTSNFTRVIPQNVQNRVVFEITGVHDLRNDPDVTVRSYHGLDQLYVSSNDKVTAGGTQRIDYERGARYMIQTHGRIVDGVLITNPVDFHYPLTRVLVGRAADFLIRGMTLRVKLTDNGGTGFIAGYADTESFYRFFTKSYGGGLLGNFNHWSPPSLYKALHKLADGYPDPVTGKPTAISMALSTEFVRVMVAHDPAMEKDPITTQTAAAQK